jgi:hypothetical protein
MWGTQMKSFNFFRHRSAAVHLTRSELSSQGRSADPRLAPLKNALAALEMERAIIAARSDSRTAVQLSLHDALIADVRADIDALPSYIEK